MDQERPTEAGTPMTPERLAEWRAEKIKEALERACTGADICLHGVAQGLIDEGVADTHEAHRMVAEAMINELLDHGLEVRVDSDGVAHVTRERDPLDWG